MNGQVIVVKRFLWQFAKLTCEELMILQERLNTKSSQECSVCSDWTNEAEGGGKLERGKRMLHAWCV